ncbi:MAG: SurA N-terminal domain-containing protein [Verrucomicrobia bacterium]|nr:SurA N-terminal domain-containing protein [Verrucomicrobiota bacterium]
MFATIRRHQNWLWAIIIGVVIVSFVIFFSPNAGLQAGFGRVPLGAMYGQSISQEQWLNARREVELNYLFRLGSWVGQDAYSRQFLDRINDEVRRRLVLIHQLEAFHVEVGDDATAKWITEIGLFHDKGTKRFNPDIYAAFVQRVLPSNPNGIRLTEQDFENYARHEIGLMELASLFGMSGALVTPRDAEAEYRYDHEQAVVEAGVVSTSNHLAGVVLDAAGLGQFYTNRLAVYRIPERVQVSYVKFAASNHLAQADAQLAKQTNLAERIEEVYQEQGTNFFHDAQDRPLPEAAAKAEIRQRLRKSLALQDALKEANEFATRLFKLSPAQAENLDRLARTNRLTVHVTEPFTATDGPREINGLETFNQAAFGLSLEEPFAAPIKGEDGIYLIAFRKRLPSQIPTLDSIRDRVTADYRRFKALQLARAAGQRFYETVTNRLAHGQSFRAVCATAGIQWRRLPPFPRRGSDPPELDQEFDVRELRSVAFGLRPGKASSFTPTPQGGFVLYLDKFVPTDPATMKAELPEYVASLRKARLSDAFDEWFQHQYSLAHVTKPAGQSEPAAAE